MPADTGGWTAARVLSEVLGVSQDAVEHGLRAVRTALIREWGLDPAEVELLPTHLRGALRHATVEAIVAALEEDTFRHTVNAVTAGQYDVAEVLATRRAILHDKIDQAVDAAEARWSPAADIDWPEVMTPSTSPLAGAV